MRLAAKQQIVNSCYLELQRIATALALIESSANDLPYWLPPAVLSRFDHYSKTYYRLHDRYEADQVSSRLVEQAQQLRQRLNEEVKAILTAAFRSVRLDSVYVTLVKLHQAWQQLQVVSDIATLTEQQSVVQAQWQQLVRRCQQALPARCSIGGMIWQLLSNDLPVYALLRYEADRQRQQAHCDQSQQWWQSYRYLMPADLRPLAQRMQLLIPSSLIATLGNESQLWQQYRRRRQQILTTLNQRLGDQLPLLLRRYREQRVHHDWAAQPLPNRFGWRGCLDREYHRSWHQAQFLQHRLTTPLSLPALTQLQRMIVESDSIDDLQQSLSHSQQHRQPSPLGGADPSWQRWLAKLVLAVTGHSSYQLGSVLTEFSANTLYTDWLPLGGRLPQSLRDSVRAMAGVTMLLIVLAGSRALHYPLPWIQLMSRALLVQVDNWRMVVRRSYFDMTTFFEWQSILNTLIGLTMYLLLASGNSDPWTMAAGYLLAVTVTAAVQRLLPLVVYWSGGNDGVLAAVQSVVGLAIYHQAMLLAVAVSDVGQSLLTRHSESQAALRRLGLWRCPPQQSTLRHHYLERALESHPDKQGSNADMAAINDAYAVARRVCRYK